MATICKNGTKQITKDFSEKELYSKSLDAPQCHYLDDKTINALQAIRDWANTPIRVTSTLRTKAGNDLIGGVSNSRHLEPASAIDFQFIDNRDAVMQRFYEDFRCKGSLYRKLRSMGINGIGIYGTFIHIDTRSSSVKSFWDESAGKYGDTRVTNAYMAQIPESGLSGSQCDVQSEIIAEATDSEYGLTGIFAPIDPRNYSGEDGLKSQERGLINLLIGGLLLVGGAVALLIYNKKKPPTDVFQYPV